MGNGVSTPPPDDDTWNNQTIPHSALDDFYDLVAKTATQGNRQRILEQFKGAFYSNLGLNMFGVLAKVGQKQICGITWKGQQVTPLYLLKHFMNYVFH